MTATPEPEFSAEMVEDIARALYILEYPDYPDDWFDATENFQNWFRKVALASIPVVLRAAKEWDAISRTQTIYHPAERSARRQSTSKGEG